jgi:ribonucleotide monophosphatase NagD (HAD superfamily)
MTERVKGLGGLTPRFDAFLVDQFGVLLNGSGAYPSAANALAELARRGKRNLVLSNSGERSAENEARLVQP